jgi:predicted transcriptional regulator
LVHAEILARYNTRNQIRVSKDISCDIADRVSITERAVQRIVHELVEEGYLTVEKEGRRNHYQPKLDASLRHPLEAGVTIRDLLDALARAGAYGGSP